MTANPFLGVGLHATGGLAAGSFYLPFKRVRMWSWETYWLVGGVFSWLIVPWVVALLSVSDPVAVLRAAPGRSVLLSFGFGVLWGIGGLTFGLSMRFLGLSLGYAVALGFSAAFGTLIPPLFAGEFGTLLSTPSGLITLAGVAISLAGIGLCGWAGAMKERELPAEAKQAAVREYNFGLGMVVAFFCGIMSSCMAYAITAAAPIAAIAADAGAPPMLVNSPAFIVIFAGGLITNAVWCIILHLRNRSYRDYTDTHTPLALNYPLAAAAGTIWYFQFMFYGMGTTQMGEYDFSSWSLHMSFIIVFSNLWGLLLGEWKGVSRRTLSTMLLGLAVLILSTVIIGYGANVVAEA